MASAPEFRWGTALGVSVALFLVIGALWVFVGALSVPLHNRDARTMFATPRTDSRYFGRDSRELIATDPVVSKYRTLWITVVAGFLLLGGTLVVALAWFGLRRNEAWALAALATGILLAVALWAVAVAPYFRAGVPLTLGDAPPFIWAPAVLVIPATVLGWIGLR